MSRRSPVDRASLQHALAEIPAKRMTSKLPRHPLLLAFFGVCIAASQVSVLAARPNPPPGNVTNLDTDPFILGITLKFTAGGEDGLSGTATGYEVRYLENTSSCVSDPSAWFAAYNAEVQVPVPGGSADKFQLRMLQPGMPYCVAIRMRDKAGQASASWARTLAPVETLTTMNGTWTSLTHQQALGSTSEFGWEVNAALDPNGDEMHSWTLRSGVSGDLVFQRPGQAPFVVDNSGAFTVVEHHTQLASNRWRTGTQGQFAAVLSAQAKVASGKKPANERVQVVEVSANDSIATVDVAYGAQVSGGIDRGQDSGLAYTASGNLVVSYVRTDDSSSSSLMVRDVSSGSLALGTPADVLSMSGSSSRYVSKALFTTPDGRPAMLAEHCGRVVYTERSAAAPGATWLYWDAGVVGGNNFYRYQVAYDPYRGTTSTDQLVAAVSIWNATSTATSVVLGFGADFLSITKPSSVCAPPVQGGAPAWEVIAGVDDPERLFPRASGLVASQEALLIALTVQDDSLAGGQDVERRLVYRCSDADAGWSVEKFDRLYQSANVVREFVLDASGDVVSTYGASARPNVVPQLAYVYTATRSGNACNVVP